MCVADECGGIPPGDLPRVFDVAFRGESARTPDPSGGAGLGLSIARGIVEAHSGQISVRNTGPGCQFTDQPAARPPGPVRPFPGLRCPPRPGGAVAGGARRGPSYFRKARNRGKPLLSR